MKSELSKKDYKSTKIDIPKLYIDKSTNYEIKRMRQDSLAIIKRLQVLDSVNNEHFNKYASHRSQYLELSSETLFRRDSLASLLVLNYFVLKDSINSIKYYWHESKTSFENLGKSKNSTDSIFLKTRIYKSFLDIEGKLLNAENILVGKSNSFIQQIEFLQRKDLDQNNLVAFLPEVSTFFGKAGFFAPSINLLGNQVVKGKAFEGTIKLFSTSLPSQEKIDWRALAVQQTSEFGIVADFLGGFKKIENGSEMPRNLGIRFGSSFLYKRGLNSNGQKDTTYNFGMFHSHLGLEYVVVPKILAFYADYNQQFIGTNLSTISKFDSNLDSIKSNLGFYNTGIKFLITPTGGLSKNLKNFPVIIDLNLIWVSTRYAILDKNKSERIFGDRVIPNIKVALKL